jgi:hypothetical protein
MNYGQRVKAFERAWDALGDGDQEEIDRLFAKWLDPFIDQFEGRELRARARGLRLDKHKKILDRLGKAIYDQQGKLVRVKPEDLRHAVEVMRKTDVKRYPPNAGLSNYEDRSMRQKYLAREMRLGFTAFVLAACTTTRPVLVDPTTAARPDATLPSESHTVTLTAGPFSPPAVAPTRQALAALYKEMGPLEAYLGSGDAEEVAIARSATPRTISRDAEILTLAANGYHRVVAGTNGWTCLVQRSWNNDYDDPEFWNPKIRIPICFNAPASRTVLPVYLERTLWVLAKRSLPAVLAIAADHSVPDPERGSLAIMMSKHSYVGDAVGTLGPHLMVFLSGVPAETWGANLDGMPITSASGDKPSITIFFLGARVWSDGTPR